jgi:hypothetical protein
MNPSMRWRRRPLRPVLAVAFALAAFASHLAAGDGPLWNAAWITDTQTPEREWIATLVARVAADKPKLVLHTGDTRFEWANRCAWREVMTLLTEEAAPIELHLATGNHDLTNGLLDAHLRSAASRGVYRIDTGRIESGRGYYHDRVTEDATGPLWPVWNPEVAVHPAWDPSASKVPANHMLPDPPYRYVFRRGGIRFIVCDCYYTDEQRDWVRGIIAAPDDSSLSILLQHRHEVEDLSRYFVGLEGRHNVRLVLSGDHHNYCFEERGGVTFITSAGMAQGSQGDNDALTLRVYADRLEIDRYVLPKGLPMSALVTRRGIWKCPGRFSPYGRPETAGAATRPEVRAPIEASTSGTRAMPAAVAGPNLLTNGDFDNHIWYERFRGWSPSGWYEWFARGGHAPEHAVGRYPSPPYPAHSGEEYVRIHMWGHEWRGGILQVVRGVTPGRYYRMTAHGFFQPDGAPNPRERIGIDPCGTFADQFAVDVSKHPAPPYDEGVGDDPKTAAFDGLDIDEGTVWSPLESFYRWGRFEVEAEARSDAIVAILYCAPDQRPADRPIYEMNWDSVALREAPWPAPRLVEKGAALVPDDRPHDVVVTVQKEARTAQVTWGTKAACGTVQALLRLHDAEAQGRARRLAEKAEKSGEWKLLESDYPIASPVDYGQVSKRHRVEIRDLEIPPEAVEVEAIALSRICEGKVPSTIASRPARASIDRR